MEVFHARKAQLKASGLMTAVVYESGFASNVPSNTASLDAIPRVQESSPRI